MRKDDQMLNAMYIKVHQEVIEEAGLFSRVGARLGGAYDAAKQAVGDVATAVSGKAPAPDAGWRGKYTAGKQERIIGTLTDDIINDLKKLGLISSPQDVNKKELEGVLNKYLDGINANTKTPTAASREPSTPVATPDSATQPEAASESPVMSNPNPAKPAPVMGTSSTSSPVAPKSEPVESEAGEAQTDEDKAKSEARRNDTKERISNKPQPNHSKVKDKKGVEFTFKGTDSKGNHIWKDAEGNTSPGGGLLSQKWQTERESKNESFKSFFWQV
jgi:hypothetical protein